MITDDPGTPGNGRWEINLAVAFEHRQSETSWDLPMIDLNYGVGERIQLTLQSAPVLLKRSGQGSIGGIGGTEAALKWRFLDEERDGVSMSIFPRIIFNVVQSSARRGLSEAGTRVRCPMQIAKKFGVVDLDLEAGSLTSTVGRSEWLYGIVGAIEVSKTTAFMAELQGTARTSFARDTLTVNVGVRHKLKRLVDPDCVVRPRGPIAGRRTIGVSWLLRRAAAVLKRVVAGVSPANNYVVASDTATSTPLRGNL